MPSPIKDMCPIIACGKKPLVFKVAILSFSSKKIDHVAFVADADVFVKKVIEDDGPNFPILCMLMAPGWKEPRGHSGAFPPQQGAGHRVSPEGPWEPIWGGRKGVI